MVERGWFSVPEPGEDMVQKLSHLRLATKLVERLKGFYSELLLDTVDRLFQRVGHLAYPIGALLFLAFYVVLAIKLDTLNLFFLAFLVIVPALVVGHYSAAMFLASGSRLLAKLPSRLFSRALPDCAGLLAAFASVGCLLGGVYTLIQVGDWVVFGACCVVSAIGAYLTGLLLCPASLHVEIDEEGGAGEEALGILAFGLKLIPRLAPVVYGVGSLAGVGMAVLFIIQAGRGEVFSIGVPVLGELSILDLTIRFLGLGFVPLLAYLAFVGLHLVLTVLRAVLAFPERPSRVAVRPAV